MKNIYIEHPPRAKKGRGMKKKVKGTGKPLRLSKGWLHRLDYRWHVTPLVEKVTIESMRQSFYLRQSFVFDDLGSALQFMGYTSREK